MEEREEDDDNPSTKSLFDKFILVSVLVVLIVVQQVTATVMWGGRWLLVELIFRRTGIRYIDKERERERLW